MLLIGTIYIICVIIAWRLVITLNKIENDSCPTVNELILTIILILCPIINIVFILIAIGMLLYKYGKYEIMDNKLINRMFGYSDE